jgi:hypothetical protein
VLNSSNNFSTAAFEKKGVLTASRMLNAVPVGPLSSRMVERPAATRDWEKKKVN